MPGLFTGAGAFSAVLASLLTAALGFAGIWVHERNNTRRQRTALQATEQGQRTSEYGKIVSDAVRLKQEFQDDYEAIRKRMTTQEEQLAQLQRRDIDKDAQIDVLRRRVLTLEEENHYLRQQLIQAGIQAGLSSPTVTALFTAESPTLTSTVSGPETEPETEAPAILMTPAPTAPTRPLPKRAPPTQPRAAGGSGSQPGGQRGQQGGSKGARQRASAQATERTTGRTTGRTTDKRTKDERPVLLKPVRRSPAENQEDVN